MIEAFVIAILIVIISILIFLIIRLANKIKFYEDWILQFRDRIIFTQQALRQSDIMVGTSRTAGAFESDDEVGYAFKAIDMIINDIKSFVDVVDNTEKK